MEASAHGLKPGQNALSNASAIFVCPKRRKNGWRWRKRVGRMVGGSREQVYAEGRLPWLRELDALKPLRRVWMQHAHANEHTPAWRADGELPPSALLLTSPSDVQARVRPQEKHGLDR